ncbi:hypothetical protein [Devosia sp. Root105]|uniref:hypothetical protein n=1 Tax=Devosia sp. Root105 TaxID=1736423 RepID=UPI000A6C47D9|nr:hypothetical protein [Devosia sp. Root105]
MLKHQTLDGQDTDDRNDPEAPAAPLSNGGPPLNDSPRPWGDNGIGNYFEWKAASEKAFNDVPYDIAVMRARRAEAMGLTYREYTLEILERGRYLSADADAERIAEIKRRRPIRY